MNRRDDLSRRDWLGFIGGAALVAGLAPRLASDPTPGVAATAIVEPTSTSFIVVVHAPNVAAVMIAIHKAGELIRLSRLELENSSSSGALEVTGLTPDTRYVVEVASGDDAEPSRSTVQTAPRDDDPRPVTIAIGADVDPNPEFASDIFGALTRHAPDLFVSLGDFPYTDDGPPATTIAEYRERHLLARQAPPIRDFLASTGMRAIYDDHEFHNDWNPAFVEAEPERYAAAITAWNEFFPIRTATTYRRWRWGANLECFLLDARLYRSRNAAPDGPDKTMLGAAQLAWLIAGLRSSTAPFKLVLSSVPLDFGNGDDHWASFAHERDRMFAAIVDVPGVVFASADQHWFASHRHAFGVREFQVGPLMRGLGSPAEPVAGVLARHLAYNFGLVEVSPTTLTFSGVGADGTHFYKENLNVADLTPRR